MIFKMPIRLPPSIVMLIGFGLGVLTSTAYYWNLASKNDAETLLSDAKVGIEITNTFEKRSKVLTKELEIVNEQLIKFGECANRTPVDDILIGVQRTNNDKKRTNTIKRVQPLQETEQGEEYLRGLRDRISKVFTSE